MNEVVSEFSSYVAPDVGRLPWSPRKLELLKAADVLAPKSREWRNKNLYFHQEDERYARFLIRPGLRVLELGCGSGDLLASLNPAEGVGVDFSPAMIGQAKTAYPQLEFIVGDVESIEAVEALKGRVFDVILLSDTVGAFDDVQRTFELLHGLCDAETRIVVAYHSRLWEPILRAAETMGLKRPTSLQNWLSSTDISSICALADFEEIKREWRVLIPKRLLGLGPLINRFLGTLPLVRRLCVRNFIVLRSLRHRRSEQPSVSVIVPCRNERGNIEAAVLRTPVMAPDQEMIFVEGHSSDGTLDEIKNVIARYPDRNIRVTVQTGVGKGDAVRAGFDMATGEVLMILDADLTMPPEDLPKYYGIIASGKAEFVNGSRLVYPMQGDAMRFLNLVANRIFAALFSYMLNQRFTDTLCGTKVLSKRHYQDVSLGRPYFGNFDPFGDFDLIFGASKLNLKIAEIPIRYLARTYGTTQISRFRHGLLLLRMVGFAWWKMKAI